MKVKEKDFIEIDYLAKIQDTGQVFDLTDETAAKEHNLYDSKRKYGPIVICVGKKDVIQGLDKE